MSFNFGETRDIIIFKDRNQYKKINQIKTNFRVDISNKSLDEGMMINFPYQNVYYSYKTETKYIPFGKKFKRAGVIPYTFIDGRKYYCMGVDFEHGNLTDFGGGIKKTESFASGAARELYEESLGVFNFNHKNIYANSIAIHDSNMIIMFVYVKVNNIKDTVELFYKNYYKTNNPETQSINWVPEEIFFDLVKGGKSIRTQNVIYPAIYKPVADLLRSVSSNNEII